MTCLENLIKDSHKVAREHGWWDKPKTVGELISLMHSELSEALEFERNNNNLKEKGIDYLYHYSGKILHQELINDLEGTGVVVEPTLILSNVLNSVCKKPDGVLPELADTIIRIFDYVGSIDMVDEFVAALLEKHEFNKTRPYRHGNKSL